MKEFCTRECPLYYLFLSLIRILKIFICLCSTSCPRYPPLPSLQYGLVLLNCILNGLGVQNQKRNFCLDPTYFTEMGMRCPENLIETQDHQKLTCLLCEDGSRDMSEILCELYCGPVQQTMAWDSTGCPVQHCEQLGDTAVLPGQQLMCSTLAETFHSCQCQGEELKQWSTT